VQQDATIQDVRLPFELLHELLYTINITSSGYSCNLHLFYIASSHRTGTHKLSIPQNPAGNIVLVRVYVRKQTLQYTIYFIARDFLEKGRGLSQTWVTPLFSHSHTSTKCLSILIWPYFMFEVSEGDVTHSSIVKGIRDHSNRIFVICYQRKTVGEVRLYEHALHLLRADLLLS
jgi:hypothetical protein